MKNYIKYICLFLITFNVSVGVYGAGIYIEYNSTMYYDGSTIDILVDFDGSLVADDNTMYIKNNAGWTYSSYNYGYIHASIEGTYVYSNVAFSSSTPTGNHGTPYWIDGTHYTSFAEYNNEWQYEYITFGVGYAFDAPGIYSQTITVTQKDNNDAATLQSATITLRYILPEEHTVGFSVGYGSTPSARTGTSITLPTIPAVCSDASAAGWEPYGWATSSVAVNSSSASIVGVAGDTYYPDADRTLYAVYRKPGVTISAGSTDFALQSSGGKDVSPFDRYMPTEGYVILTQVTQPATAISNSMSGNFIVGVGSGEVTYTSSPSPKMSTTNATCVWEVAMPTDGEFTFRNITTGQYLGLESTTKAALLSTATDYAKWTVVKTSTDGYYLKNKSLSDYYLNFSSGYGWRGNSSYNGTTDNIHIFKAASSVTTSGDKFQSSLPLCGYQVTYNGNGNTSGSVPTDANVYTSGATVTVKSNSGSLAKTGYTFSGWNTNNTGTGTNYAAGSGTFSITSDVTLYAKWVAKEYTVNLDKQDGSGGSTSVTATYNAAMPSAGSAPTLSEYTFGGYYGSAAGGGTQYYNSTPASAHVWDVDVNPSTIYAKWTQVVTLDKNTGSSNGSVTVTYKGSGTSSFTAVTKTGYECTGYWDNTSGGNKVITSAGALVSYSASVSSYINSSGKWCHSGATTLYAQWSAKTYTVTLNQGDGTGGSTSVTATYGADMPSATMPTAPTGYTFAGYYYGETLYYNADGSSARTWDIAAPTTLTARYTTNTPTLTVASVDDVTITATPSGESAISEGDSEEIAYNTSVELASTGLTTNYYFEGWDVYETGNSGNKVTVTSNSFTMPNYPVTVSAIIRSNTSMKAWCPVITLEWTDGSTPILITSVKDQSVKAVRTLHLTVTGAATPAAVVTLSGTDLEFYKSDGTKITSSNLTCSSYALDATIYVAYKPTGDYSDDSWNAPDITASCSSTDVVVSDLVNVRRLPDNGTESGQGFVIAAKVGDEWVALPSAMSAGAQDGLPITVDDEDDPTEATQAPSSAIYNLYNVYTSNGPNDRHKVYGTYAYLAGNGSKVLKSASSGTNLSLGVNASTYTGGSADAAYFEWLLSTTDKKNYTMTNNGRTAQLKYYTTHGKFGMYAYNSQVVTEFRLLPATVWEEAPMQILEWKSNSVVVMYTGSETTATTKVGTNGESSSQTLANNKLTHGIYELTTDQALTSNDGALLEIAFGDGSTKKIVEIPIIITGNSTAADGHASQDVVICDGGKLTAAASSYDYYNIYVYGGGKLDIPSGKALGVNNIILRAGGLSTSGIGSSPSATYQYVYPQVGLIGTLTSAEANIQYEYITDYYHWYHLCLPFNATLSSIHYPQEYYGNNVTADNSGSWIIKRYAGEIRATGEYNAWKDIETEGATSVTAGKGYIFWGAPKKVSVGGAAKVRQDWGIQRMTMATSASAATTAETANKDISVDSYSEQATSTKQNDQGWNLVGNPYMVNLTGLSSEDLIAGQLVHSDTDPWDGKWVNDGTGTRYVTIPDNHFESYTAQTMSWFTKDNPMINGRVFFVQIAEGASTLTFATANRAALVPALYRTEQTVDIETGIVMTNETLKDEVDFWIKDGKTEAYEFNADYPKTPNQTNFNIYGVHETGNLSWIAISPEIAEGSMAIGYQVPAAGDYTLSLSEKFPEEKIEALFVTDHAMSPEVTTNLTEENYTFTVHQAESNDERFTVSVKLKKQTDVVTDIGTGGTIQTQAVKFIHNDKLYILRNGLIYDATGKRVSVINK